MKTILSVLALVFMTSFLSAQTFLVPRVQTVTIPNPAPWLLLDTNGTNEASTYYVIGSFQNFPSIYLFGKKVGIFPDALTIASLAYANQGNFVNFQGTIKPNDAGKPILMIPNNPFLRGLTMYFVAITWNPFRQNQLSISPVSTVITQ